MLHAILSGYLGELLALFLLSFHSRFPGVLDGEHAPHALDGLHQGGRLVQVAADDLCPELGQGLSGLALRMAG
jgi:hypothetical protein